MLPNSWSRWVLVGIVCAVAVSAETSWAVTAGTFIPSVENKVAAGYNSLVNLWVPVMSFGAMVALAGNAYFKVFDIPKKAMGLAGGAAVVGGGLPWLSALSGGTIATTLILPL